MPIYVNTTIPIEQLSEEQRLIELNNRKRITKQWFDKHREVLYKNHCEWARLNKDHISNYRQDNRERIREYYRKYMEKKSHHN
jgi:excinuclease UvrABC ATPase subunit